MPGAGWMNRPNRINRPSRPYISTTIRLNRPNRSKRPNRPKRRNISTRTTRPNVPNKPNKTKSERWQLIHKRTHKSDCGLSPIWLFWPGAISKHAWLYKCRKCMNIQLNRAIQVIQVKSGATYTHTSEWISSTSWTSPYVNTTYPLSHENFCEQTLASSYTGVAKLNLLLSQKMISKKTKSLHKLRNTIENHANLWHNYKNLGTRKTVKQVYVTWTQNKRLSGASTSITVGSTGAQNTENSRFALRRDREQARNTTSKTSYSLVSVCH